ncbi:diguanylate cyclase (GGDEF)-like protein [Rhizobium sp. BK529]|uniref:putative bifunctional diguanylate cyclase/phosphodiesterase n=1 Tax=unclassified Rhizobium TaxID=2613769 RepID=UPI0010488615|nr:MULTISPECIES: EAL domain-containing protein [unclassified Rhizobium]MBB3593921.1 diguanylate cyclase (GGDEF)-like protein [Rhizobium sp. BK529]TCS01377.1 periplasmic sensor diguanylate cyclase/phosphodiesterase [Rhizobium sp. BK418]
MPADPSVRLSAHRATWTSSGSILVLLAISGLAILGLVFLAAIWAGEESDAAALDRQRQLVDGRLHDQLERVSQDMQLMGAGYASLLVGDSAAAGGRSERAGARSAATFGKIATTVFGYNAAFLVTPEGELALQSDSETKRRFKWVRPLLQPMIQELEAKQHGAPQGPSSDPEPSRVELMRLEGRPSVAGVVSVTGSSGGDAQQGNPGGRLYLVALRFLDGVTLDTLSREQGLAGARYARTADQEKNEVAFQIAATATGEPIGFIIWTPDLPGSRVIGRLVPVLSIAGLVIAGLFFALMGRLRASLRDLSASEHHARHLSLHDVLTGLPNRALFAARFEQCLAAMKAADRRAVLALVDLDRFKEVNDIHGHPAGDELLRCVVDRMNALIKSGDTLARVGGDEFALLLPDIRKGDDGHVALCNEIIEALSRPFQLRGGDIVVRIGCSIGIAVFQDATQAISEILRRADVALYEAKTSGRGRVIAYDPSMDHRVEARESLKNDLRLVLEDPESLPAPAGNLRPDDLGHLEVFFQGVHRAEARGGLSGAEALVRWRHPTRGLLSPNKFIPIAEEAGMIDQLGEWVLRSAARAAVRWPAHMSVAVNVSPSQIKHRDFDRHVLSILAETGLQPSRLELELTEAALFDIDENAQATLGKLRSQGIRIALDDFGTGFSSLSHLIQLNIDRIKIDRSFVRLLGTQAEGAAIVSAILGLSRTLGKATTAEGVETEGQRDFLVAAGCNDLQGFLFSRPMPLADFLSSLRLAEAVSQARG